MDSIRTPERLLVRGAHVVSMDESLGDLPGGDILIENGTIAGIGTALPVPEGTPCLDASDMIALPGLIDAHNCLWQTALRGAVPDLWPGTYFTEFLPLRARFQAEDNHLATFVGAHEALSYGTTTVVDYCHNIRGPGFAAASIDALRASGIRHVFTYSFLSERPDGFATQAARLGDARAVHARFDGRDALTHVHFGIDSVGTSSLVQQLELARTLGARSCIHVNAAHDIRALAQLGLLGADLMAIHGNLITDAELAAMARAGMPICFTPSADVQGTPADVVRRATAHGVPVVYGCDVPSHVASDLLMQLRVMLHVQGYIDGAIARSFNAVHTRRPPVRPGMPLLRPRDLLRAATVTAARVLGLDHLVGSLTPGKAADLLLVRKGEFGESVDGDACAHLLLQACARDIDTVLVGGRARMRAGRLLGFDAQRAKAALRQARQRLWPR